MKINNVFTYLLTIFFCLLFLFGIYKSYQKSHSKSKGNYINKVEAELIDKYCKSKNFENLDKKLQCISNHKVLFNDKDKTYTVVKK